MSRITLKDVAKKAGVSTKTVSRVLNNEPNVAPQTLEKIQKTIEELNYVPNQAARNLSSGKAKAIGLVIGWPVTAPFSNMLIERTLQECEKYDYALELYSIVDGLTQKIVDAFLGRKVDGVLLDTNSADHKELMEKLNELHVPYVVVQPNMNGKEFHFPYIQIDNYNGAKQAVRYLISLGHREIGFISYKTGLSQEDERRNGYADALKEAGIPLKEEYLIHCIEWPYHIGHQSTMKLLPANPSITAIFAATDQIAIGSYKAIWQLGLRVPDDISVVGFDDIPISSMMVPPLTTIHQPVNEIAARAVSFLVELIDEPVLEPMKLMMPTQLIVRESCKPIKAM